MVGRGTTPTVTWTFKSISTADLAVCVMTLKTVGLTIEKTLDQARVVNTGNLEWSFTQEETLKFGEDPIDLQIRYRTADGRAFISKIYTVSPYQILKDGVI